jgi:hypothetical protein
MKKSAILPLICMILALPVAGQKGLLNKVSKSVSGAANSVLGSSDAQDKQEPEPSCASDLATIAMDLGGNLKLDYKELSISILSDGRILAQAHGMDEYYIAKDGKTSGPFKAGDPQIADFVTSDEGNEKGKDPVVLFKPYVSAAGEKYMINFAGKKYGPFSIISDLKVSKSKDKFAAIVTESVAVTENQAKKMEAAMKNAKDDQERMELAMEYAQLMQQNVDFSKGAEALSAKLVSNVPVAALDPMKSGNLNSEVKYDDILLVTYDSKVYDLQGKLLVTLKQEAAGAKHIFINSAGNRYAYYNSGVLTFSDNTKLTDLFNTNLVRTDGKVFINYMYYSPKHNAIMQHKIPF